MEETASTVPLSYSHSDATSPTIPLTLDEDGLENASVLDLQETPGRQRLDTDMEDNTGAEDVWPKLFSSPPSQSANANRHDLHFDVDRESLGNGVVSVGLDHHEDQSWSADDYAIDPGPQGNNDDDLDDEDPTTRYDSLADLDLAASLRSPEHGKATPLSLPIPSQASSHLELDLQEHPLVQSRSTLEPPGSSPIVSDGPARSPSPRAPEPACELSPPAAIDPELNKFRSARTFRTRTMLQLQPYTKERQAYEAALRKGGLKKGKRAVAAARDISEDEEDQEEEGQQSSSSEEDDPERIVIGETESSPRQNRKRKPVEILDIDRDEFYLQYGTQAIDDVFEDEAKLQSLARARRKAEKIERRKAREAAKARAEFEQMLHGDDENPGRDNELVRLHGYDSDCC